MILYNFILLTNVTFSTISETWFHFSTNSISLRFLEIVFTFSKISGICFHLSKISGTCFHLSKITISLRFWCDPHNVCQDVKNVQDLFYDLIEPLLDESRAQQSLKKNITQIQIEVESLRLKEPATFQDVTLKVLGKIFKTDIFSARNLKLVIGDVTVGTSTNTNWWGSSTPFRVPFHIPVLF